MATLVVLGVLAWIFVVPSCSTKFGCDSAPATAYASDADCPEDLTDAAKNADWAASRIESIKDDDLTTGLLYDDEGTEQRIESGESGEAFDLAVEYLKPYAGRQIRDQPAGKQAAGHVEPKAAALMRNDGQIRGVLVINNPDGPCIYSSGAGCQAAIKLILPKGGTLTVWWPGDSHAAYTGVADQ